MRQIKPILSMKNQFNRLTLVAICAGLLSTVAVRAQNPAVPLTAPAPQPQWETLASAGLTLTKGNSDTMLANLGVTTTKKWTANEISLGASMTYGEVSGVQNVNNYNGNAQYNRLFSERLYGGLKLNATKDDIANIDYRLTLSPLLGYYFLKEPATQLSAEVGPSYVIEKLGATSRSYAGLRLGERFEHKFSDRAKLWQTAEFIPQVDQFSQYLINVELGVDSTITKQVSLRAVLQDNYNSKPAVGRKANDLRLITGIAYKF
jgi:putative salt-induced outer membrane protein YdiY